MIANQKLLILLVLFLVFLMMMLPSCATIHETTSSHPKMTLREATASMKEAIKATTQDPFAINVKVVTDIDISEHGITLINADFTKRYYVFSDMIDPTVGDNPINQIYFVKLKQELNHFVAFTNPKSAIMFADALYYVKHTDIKQEREKVQADSLGRIQQTAIEEQKEREKKQAESLRLIQKTPIKDESDVTGAESSSESTAEKRKSQPRPTQQRKSSAPPPQRQPEGGPPPLPALPPGGAVSGN